MSKFCGNCGTQLPDDAVVCSNCGVNLGAPAQAPAAATAAPAANSSAFMDSANEFVGKVKSDKKTLGIVIGAAAAAVVLIIVLVLTLFCGGNEALDNYFDHLYEGDYDSYLALYPEEYWDKNKDSKLKESKYDDAYEKRLESLEDKYGEDISWSYDILKEKEFSKGDFNELAESVAKAWNVNEDDVDDAMIVWYEVIVEGDDEDATYDSVEQAVLVEVNGTWYIWDN